MIFTDAQFFAFFILLFVLYWAVRSRVFKNTVLLIGGYIFYGWIHPWFCLLLAASTIVDFGMGLAIQSSPNWKRFFVIVSLCFNLGLLAIFKYFNFFSDSVVKMLSAFGIHQSALVLNVFLPVGISFYTFQSLSYIIDVYRGKTAARSNLLDYAVYVSFFPQLVSGPIERAPHFLPQVESDRNWSWDRFHEAWPLLVMGYFKKIFIANNVAIFVNKIFMLQSPTLMLLFAGALGFTVQIYTDFSGYTDMARGFAKLLGFDLVENFNSPYLAISPSDFWRRWHISLSTWFRDYVYIPLGGSKVSGSLNLLFVYLVTFSLSGLWHGAAWHFVLWGIYHAILLFIYHQLGLGSKWQPQGPLRAIPAWLAMSSLTVVGWTLFRTPSMAWLLRVFQNASLLGNFEETASALAVISLLLLYALPLIVRRFIRYTGRWKMPLEAVYLACAMTAVIIYIGAQGQDFIYFQF